ncbi:MAG: putative Fe-S cluster assembly protein SufT [Gammaproteobacteria bacterium]|nr:putative Fe-S cluster assembly protein SufT [Gammaproteobacteria bacterium]
MNAEIRKLKLGRDVVGTLIPAGTRVELPAGAEATLTQALGGSYTVQVEGHLFRIEGKDADAIGLAAPSAPELSADASDADIERAVWTQLATCYDPEIPINIVDLGLIYECRVEPGECGRKVSVKMTLTAPGCGMGDILVADAREKIVRIPSVEEAQIELTFDPPWSREMMSEAALLQAGFI